MPAEIPEPPSIVAERSVASTAVPVAPAPEAPPPAPEVAAPVAATRYVPPRLIDAARLLLRRADRAMLRAAGANSITIKLRVDEQGRVVRAEADAIPGVPQSVLTYAEHAAFLCRFEPARQGDTPAPGQFTIQLRIR